MTEQTRTVIDRDPVPLLEVEGLVKRFPIRRGLFGSGAVHAVEGVDLQIHAGEVLSLVGESGSGKSTLGMCVTGMSTPTAGRIRFAGEDVALASRRGRADFRRRVQPVFQDPRSSLDPRWPIERTIREPLDAYRVGSSAERTARVAELMDLVGLPRHFASRQPRELSGGQQQRVAIAAALALRPELLVADEPVSALDVSVQAQILNLLDELRNSGRASLRSRRGHVPRTHRGNRPGRAHLLGTRTPLHPRPDRRDSARRPGTQDVAHSIDGRDT
jgi:ABC-type glutathione transport system ATPase component